MANWIGDMGFLAVKFGRNLFSDKWCGWSLVDRYGRGLPFNQPLFGGSSNRLLKQLQLSWQVLQFLLGRTVIFCVISLFDPRIFESWCSDHADLAILLIIYSMTYLITIHFTLLSYWFSSGYLHCSCLSFQFFRVPKIRRQLPQRPARRARGPRSDKRGRPRWPFCERMRRWGDGFRYWYHGRIIGNSSINSMKFHDRIPVIKK